MLVCFNRYRSIILDPKPPIGKEPAVINKQNKTCNEGDLWIALGFTRRLWLWIPSVKAMGGCLTIFGSLKRSATALVQKIEMQTRCENDLTEVSLTRRVVGQKAKEKKRKEAKRKPRPLLHLHLCHKFCHRLCLLNLTDPNSSCRPRVSSASQFTSARRKGCQNRISTTTMPTRTAHLWRPGRFAVASSNMFKYVQSDHSTSCFLWWSGTPFGRLFWNSLITSRIEKQFHPTEESRKLQPKIGDNNGGLQWPYDGISDVYVRR